MRARVFTMQIPSRDASKNIYSEMKKEKKNYLIMFWINNNMLSTIINMYAWLIIIITRDVCVCVCVSECVSMRVCVEYAKKICKIINVIFMCYVNIVSIVVYSGDQ